MWVSRVHVIPLDLSFYLTCFALIQGRSTWFCISLKLAVKKLRNLFVCDCNQVFSSFKKDRKGSIMTCKIKTHFWHDLLWNILILPIWLFNPSVKSSIYVGPKTNNHFKYKLFLFSLKKTNILTHSFVLKNSKKNQKPSS